MIHLQLITLSGIKLDESVYEVIIPTMDGLIGVLPGHMPLISVATNGVISVRRTAKDPDFIMEHYASSGGVVEIVNNNIRILVDEADHADEINEEEAEEAHRRALQMKAEATDHVSLERAQELVDRSAVRLQVANIKRRGQRRH